MNEIADAAMYALVSAIDSCQANKIVSMSLSAKAKASNSRM